MVLELDFYQRISLEEKGSLWVIRTTVERMKTDKIFEEVFFSLYRVLSASAIFVHRIAPVRPLSEISLLEEDLGFDRYIVRGQWNENDLKRSLRYLDNLFEEIRFINETKTNQALTPYEADLLRAKIFQKIKMWLVGKNRTENQADELVEDLYRMSGGYAKSRDRSFDDERSGIIVPVIGAPSETFGRIGINILVEKFGLMRVIAALVLTNPSYLQARTVLLRLGYITGYPMTNAQIRKLMGAKRKEDKTTVLNYLWEDILTKMWEVLENGTIEIEQLANIREMVDRAKLKFPFKIRVGQGEKQIIKIMPPRTARYELAKLRWLTSEEVFEHYLSYLPPQYREIVELALESDEVVFTYSTEELAQKFFPNVKRRHDRLVYLERILKRASEFFKGDIFIDRKGVKIKRNSYRDSLYRLYSPWKGLPPINLEDAYLKETLILLYQTDENGGLLTSQEVAERLGIGEDGLMARIKRIILQCSALKVS